MPVLNRCPLPLPEVPGTRSWIILSDLKQTLRDGPALQGARCLPTFRPCPPQIQAHRYSRTCYPIIYDVGTIGCPGVFVTLCLHLIKRSGSHLRILNEKQVCMRCLVRFELSHKIQKLRASAGRMHCSPTCVTGMVSGRPPQCGDP